MRQQSCCETERSVTMDSIAGGTICSFPSTRGIPAYFSRVPTLPETVFRAASSQVMLPNVVMRPDTTSSAFYEMGVKANTLANSIKSASPAVPTPYYLEHLMSAYPHNAYFTGSDLINARRKSTSRETTSALKSWLYEHRKNPYPTKGEKVMLAIITRMSLTQVSTWFANARRRLKKDTKLGDKDLDLIDIELVEKHDRQNGDVKIPEVRLPAVRFPEVDDEKANICDISDTEDCSQSAPTELCAQRLFPTEQSLDITTEHKVFEHEHQSKQTCVVHNCNIRSISRNEEQQRKDTHSSQLTSSREPQSRPKIWSISEIINSKTNGREKLSHKAVL